MRLTIVAPAAELLAELGAPRAAQLLGIVRDETNALIELADRRLAVGSTPALRRARDHAAAAVLDGARLRFHIDLDGVVIRGVDVALDGQDALEEELGRTTIRTLSHAMQQEKE